MSRRWYLPDRLFDGRRLHDDLALRVDAGKVTGVAPSRSLGVDPVRVKGLITPGFVDLQVNGGGGVLLNHTPTLQGMTTIAEAHRRFGTVAIMPTVITDAPEVLECAADAAIAALGEPFFAGLHIEGPHIAASRRGTHAAKFIRPLDDPTINVVKRLRDANVPVMLTLAPETATVEQIGALASMGCVVSLGHTDATADQAQSAFGAGATAVTHLFNAMSQMQGRTPGMVGAAINSDVYVGVICDGIHVSDEMVGLAIRARPLPDRMFLVSDAMPTVGGPDRFSLYGSDIRLHDGRLINSEGNLAGAHVTQAEGVARLVHDVDVTLETALRMAITTPSDLIGTTHLTQLEGRLTQDMIILDTNLWPVGPLSGF